MSKAVVSVVCYQNEEEVLTFANELKSQKGAEIVLLVTCNKTNNFSWLQKELDKLELSANTYDPGQNLGYLPGCLFGIREYIRAGNTFDWAMVSNTDLRFGDNQFFTLINNRNSDTWGVGPDIILTASGKHQNPFLNTRPSKSKITLWRFVYSNYLFFRIYFKAYDIKLRFMRNNAYYIPHTETVYALHGSAFILRRECIVSLMKLKSLPFMYGEELFVAETVLKNKKCMVLDCSHILYHNENQVTGKIPSKQKQKWFSDSITIVNRLFYK